MDEIQLKVGTLGLVVVPVAAALLSALLIRMLRPLLVRYALARPNARSAHVVPTPQGGGIAVLGAALAACAAGGLLLGFGHETWVELARLAVAALVVGIVGLIDDIRPLPPLPRLALQLIAVGFAVAALPEGARALPRLPLLAERVLLVVGGAWFVNLTNFMDGMDWMTVAEFLPVTAALALFWHWGFLSPIGGLAALALLGGLVGFAPSNRPIARLFLGDVGSLSIGLLVAFCLIDLAAHGGLVAAVLLPLYYIADSGVTLIWRLRRGDKVWRPHRMHHYQVAVARGFSVEDVLTRVVAVNLALALFAAASLLQGSLALALADLALGTFVVGKLLRDLSRGRFMRM